MTEKQGEQITFAGLGGWSGKTSPVHSVPGVRKAKTSGSSSKKRHGSPKAMPLFLDLRTDGNTQDASWEMGGRLLGDYTTHSFGECPSEGNVSRLSQILEDMVHPKYYLSAKACAGILRRAEQRGKELPKMLRMALEAQAGLYPSKREPESRAAEKEY